MEKRDIRKIIQKGSGRKNFSLIISKNNKIRTGKEDATQTLKKKQSSGII